MRSLENKASLAIIAFVALSIPVSVYTAIHRVGTLSQASEGKLLSTVNVPDNQTPILDTTFLPPGQVGLSYSTTIQGFDEDNNDSLTMTAFGLPRGFKLLNCQPFTHPTSTNNLSCHIIGTPTQTGSHRVYITLRDQNHASTQIQYQLNIK